MKLAGKCRKDDSFKLLDGAFGKRSASHLEAWGKRCDVGPAGKDVAGCAMIISVMLIVHACPYPGFGRHGNSLLRVVRMHAAQDKEQGNCCQAYCRSHSLIQSGYHLLVLPGKYEHLQETYQ